MQDDLSDEQRLAGFVIWVAMVLIIMVLVSPTRGDE
jgi:hypothetical protein